MKRTLLSGIIAVFAALTFTSCFKKSYDSPPNLGSTGTTVPTNLTIGQLRDMSLALNGAGRTLGDSTIGGVVVADDRSGNLYKQIVIEDSTGGMTVLIDQNNIYASYPVGMKIYIKLKGLYIGSYNKLPELGYNATSTGIAKIPASLLSSYIIQGSFPNTITPPHYTLAQLAGTGNSLIGTLITIDSVEFAAGSFGQGVTYAASIGNGGPTNTILNIEDCSGKSIQLYTSGYSTFQPYLTPTGKGSITCIYSVYGSSPQLILRDTTDIHFNGTRCNGSSGGGNTAATITIDSLKKVYYAAIANHSDAYTLTSSYKLSCVVTQTSATGNLSAGNIVVQDGSFKGIDLYFGSSASLPSIGDSILIDISGGVISRYKPVTGSLEIKLGSSAATGIQKIVSNKTVTPLVMTVADINSKYLSSDLEYVLVKILNPTISGSGTTYGDKLSIGDATASGMSFFNQYAIFATQTFPAHPQSVQGVLVSYNGVPEMQLRDPAIDVVP